MKDYLLYEDFFMKYPTDINFHLFINTLVKSIEMKFLMFYLKCMHWSERHE